MRKPIQIAYVPGMEWGQMDMWDQLIALCDDGTLWVMSAPRSGGQWDLLPQIPQGEIRHSEPEERHHADY